MQAVPRPIQNIITIHIDFPTSARGVHRTKGTMRLDAQTPIAEMKKGFMAKMRKHGKRLRLKHLEFIRIREGNNHTYIRLDDTEPDCSGRIQTVLARYKLVDGDLVSVEHAD
jgi:hypothetical protein